MRVVNNLKELGDDVFFWTEGDAIPYFLDAFLEAPEGTKFVGVLWTLNHKKKTKTRQAGTLVVKGGGLLFEPTLH